ncbi:MAG: PASTA domain-containing protein [Muribaculaceae bacterium]|nr:PASTA domain-containing protein [Muribaculaceae bacterium]
MSFPKQHPIIFNLLLIIVLGWLVVLAALFAIDVFTQHGSTVQVPKVKNLQLSQAVEALESCGFAWEVSDSVYSDQLKPGAVIDQDPAGGQDVKRLRKVYLTINAFSPRLVTLPNVAEVSQRQGQSMLEGMGFKNIQIRTVPSEFQGLILSISVNGRQVEPGTKVKLSSRIQLTVGDGSLVIDRDSVFDAQSRDLSEFGNDIMSDRINM